MLAPGLGGPILGVSLKPFAHFFVKSIKTGSENVSYVGLGLIIYIY